MSAIAAQLAVLPMTNPQPATKPGHGSQPLPTVDVGSTRGRILGGQLGRRCGIAVRHQGGYGKPDQQARTGHTGGGEKAANTPAPNIEPSPMITASKVPSRRASPGWVTTRCNHTTDFTWPARERVSVGAKFPGNVTPDESGILDSRVERVRNLHLE